VKAAHHRIVKLALCLARYLPESALAGLVLLVLVLAVGQ